MFQFLTNLLGGKPKTLAELVAENQRLGREIDALREARRAINAEIQNRLAKGEH